MKGWYAERKTQRDNKWLQSNISHKSFQMSQTYFHKEKTKQKTFKLFFPPCLNSKPLCVFLFVQWQQHVVWTLFVCSVLMWEQAAGVSRGEGERRRQKEVKHRGAGTVLTESREWWSNPVWFKLVQTVICWWASEGMSCTLAFRISECFSGKPCCKSDAFRQIYCSFKGLELWHLAGRTLANTVCRALYLEFNPFILAMKEFSWGNWATVRND